MFVIGIVCIHSFYMLCLLLVQYVFLPSICCVCYWYSVYSFFLYVVFVIGTVCIHFFFMLCLLLVQCVFILSLCCLSGN